MTDFVEVRGPKFAMIPEWVLYHPELNGNAVRVYGTLLRHGLSPDRCFPSIARIAKLCKVTPNTVRSSLESLAEAGAVRTVRRWVLVGPSGESQQYDGDVSEVPEGWAVRSTSNGFWVYCEETPPANIEVPPFNFCSTPPAKIEVPPLKNCSTPLQKLHPKESNRTRAIEREQNERTRVDGSAQISLLGGDDAGGLTPAVSVPDRFQEFYDAYGRKVGRAEAINEWKRAIKKVPAETIIEAATKWRAAFDASGSDPCYIPHPSRWLKREQWADELPRPKVGARQTTRAPIVERTDESMNMRFVDGKLVPA